MYMYTSRFTARLTTDFTSRAFTIGLSESDGGAEEQERDAVLSPSLGEPLLQLLQLLHLSC